MSSPHFTAILRPLITMVEGLSVVHRTEKFCTFFISLTLPQNFQNEIACRWHAMICIHFLSYKICVISFILRSIGNI